MWFASDPAVYALTARAGASLEVNFGVYPFGRQPWTNRETPKAVLSPPQPRVLSLQHNRGKTLNPAGSG